MAKRTTSKFKRKARDLYPTTDPNAVIPLLPHLPEYGTYCEPMAGNGALIALLREYKHSKISPIACTFFCQKAYDIKPRAAGIHPKDALKLTRHDLRGAKMIITNPPWSRAILHAVIEHFMSLGVPVWLLFDADWKYTQQSAPYIKHCKKIVAVGRVKWFAKTKMTGKDNCAWYLFDKNHKSGPRFYGRK